MNIQLRAVTLKDKEKIDGIRKKHNHDTASHAFSTIYLWQDDMDLSLLLEDDFFTLKTDVSESKEWFFPCGDEKCIKEFINSNLSNDFQYRYLREKDVTFLQENFPDKFQIIDSEGDDEYLYDLEEQKELKGRKLSTVRNHISRVKREHMLESAVITSENLKDAIEINQYWKKMSNEVAEIDDYYSSRKFLEEWVELDGFGVIVYVDGEAYAVVAGYPLSDNSFDMALAKQKGKVSGLSSYAKYAFYSNLDVRYSIVNAEEDLSLPGLKRVKKQMGPCGKIKMFRAIPL